MKKYNVLGIGNAVVDVISQSSDVFLEKMDIENIEKLESAAYRRLIKHLQKRKIYC